MGSDVNHASGAAALTAGVGGSSFSYSFSFLPRAKREALLVVYQFCRLTDDIVDNIRDPQANRERLARWRAELGFAIEGKSEYELLNRLIAVANRFHIPVDHFYALIRGAEMDLQKLRYESFDELEEYCHLVASSVGLMCLEVFGYKSPQTRAYAVNLGVALQLTNIIRDVAIDASYGRIYLPLEDLRCFGYSETDLFEKKSTSEFIALMAFETRRAEEYFAKALASLPHEDRKNMFAARIMERIYYHTLQKIEESRYDVFSRRIRIPRAIQFLIAIKYWFKHLFFA